MYFTVTIKVSFVLISLPHPQNEQKLALQVSILRLVCTQKIVWSLKRDFGDPLPKQKIISLGFCELLQLLLTAQATFGTFCDSIYLCQQSNEDQTGRKKLSEPDLISHTQSKHLGQPKHTTPEWETIFFLYCVQLQNGAKTSAKCMHISGEKEFIWGRYGHLHLSVGQQSIHDNYGFH